MKKIILSTIFLVLSGHVNAVPINVIDGDHDIINGTLAYDLGLTGLGHTSTLNSDTIAGWSSALSSNDIIVVEQGGLDSADTSAVTSWLSAGGRMIVLGDTRTSTDNFLTTLFGTATAPGFSTGSASQTTAVAGTTFADDPASIYYASSTHPIASGNTGIDE